MAREVVTFSSLLTVFAPEGVVVEGSGGGTE
jgi:hypothetical protein